MHCRKPRRLCCSTSTGSDSSVVQFGQLKPKQELLHSLINFPPCLISSEIEKGWNCVNFALFTHDMEKMKNFAKGVANKVEEKAVENQTQSHLHDLPNICDYNEW